MRGRGACVGLVVALIAVRAAADDGSGPELKSGPDARGVLVARPQGSDGVRQAYAERIRAAIVAELAERGYRVVESEPAAEALHRCATHECVGSALDGAEADFGLVPAMWARPGGRRELTLTLVGKSGRNLNAGTVINGDLASTTAALLDELLAKRDGLDSSREGAPKPERTTSVAGPESTAPDVPHFDRAGSGRRHPNAWKAGPIVLWTGGVATIVAVAAVAGMKTDQQSLNAGALTGWFVLGGAALAGGTTWWVIGRRNRSTAERTRGAAFRVSPRGFDLRVRF